MKIDVSELLVILAGEAATLEQDERVCLENVQRLVAARATAECGVDAVAEATDLMNRAARSHACRVTVRRVIEKVTRAVAGAASEGRTEV